MVYYYEINWKKKQQIKYVAWPIHDLNHKDIK